MPSRRGMEDEMREAAPQPEQAETGKCRSCRQPVWWVTTTDGVSVSLDVEPDPDGTIEMRRVSDVWLAAVLEQAECLFPVDRPRWRSHLTSCPQAGQRRAPRPRAQWTP